MNTPIRVGMCVLAVLTVTEYAWAQRREVIGYFPSWKRAAGGELFNPAEIPFEKLTMINYAFYVPLPDGNLAGKDSVADQAYLGGAHSTTIIGQAHQAGVKVLLSIGGWEDSDHFPSIASDPELRAAFAHACLEAIRTYKFDGIDVDWEYPGYAEHRGTKSDGSNFNLLLKTLRDSLTAEGAHRPDRYLLTAALPAGSAMVDPIDVRTIAGLLDILNIMTYDFHGPWDRLANHNSPLYPSPGADRMRNIDAAFRLYRDGYDVDPSQITIGIPFYGHTFTECTSLNSPHGGTDTVHFPPSGAFYADIVRQQEVCRRVWDDQAKVPYLVNDTWRVLISYDDAQSVREKCEYVLDHGLRGLIIWEITGDWMPDGQTPLLDAVDAVLRPEPKIVH